MKDINNYLVRYTINNEPDFIVVQAETKEDARKRSKKKLSDDAKITEVRLIIYGRDKS